MKNVLGILATTLLAGMIGVPTAASAFCTQTIYAERAYTSGTYTYVYGRLIGFYTYEYYGYTDDRTIADLIFAAVAAKDPIYVGADAASCPTTGDYRYFGKISYLYQNY